jgi:tRNA threonylcarbamoyladenosine biosynthesis protein TsaE
MENQITNPPEYETQTSRSLDETTEIARTWLEAISLKYKNSDKALVVGLSGYLGAGKTAFVKAVAKILGVNESVTSPTFVLMKFYKTNSKFDKWQNLVHLDLYRLEKKEELKALDLPRVINNKNNLIMIEWPENVGVEVDEQINFRALEEGVIVIQFCYAQF